MTIYCLFAASALGIFAAVFFGKKKSGVRGMALALALCTAFAGAAPVFAAEPEEKTVEVTVESYGKEDLAAVKKALEEKGLSGVEIKSVTYEVIKEETGREETKTLKGLSSKEDARKYLVSEDGLTADFDEIVFHEAYRAPASGYYDTAAGEDVPRTRKLKLTQNGQTFTVLLELVSSEDMVLTETREASYQAAFYGNSDRYLLGDKVVVLDEASPCFSGYETLIAEHFGLDPEKDAITGGSWGEAGDGVKTAVYTGTSQVEVPYVRSYYEEDADNPDRPHPFTYTAELRYKNGVEAGKTRYTLKGTVTYINYPGSGAAEKDVQKEGFFTGSRLIILAIILALLGIFFTIGRKKEQK